VERITGEQDRSPKNPRRGVMFGGAAAFLVSALVAAAIGYAGIAAMAFNIAWILFLFGLVFAAVFTLSEGRRLSSRHGLRLLHGPHRVGDE
jgi:uncharacterized membrane protein YtjA (UPF0391 family)